MLQMTGWIANALLLWGWWALGNKHRYGMVLGIIGSLLWATVGYQKAMWDLLTIELVLASVQVRAWWLWRKNDDGNNSGVRSGTAFDE